MKFNYPIFEEEYFLGHYEKAAIENKEIAQQKVAIIRKEVPIARSLLDVACGYGDFLKTAEAQGFDTCGLDISSFALSRAKKNCQARFFQANVEKDTWPFGNQMFDVITAFDIVEHL